VTPRRRALLVAAFGAVLVAGCAIAQVAEPDAGAIPDGPIGALGPGATGPITEIGRGRSNGFGWRYSAYESADGWCLQLELSMTAGSACGPPEPADGRVFAGVSSGRISGGPAPVDGRVRPDVAGVWVEAVGGQRTAATMLPLDDVGMEWTAFVAVLPAGTEPARAVAVDAGGAVIEIFDLP